MTRVGSQRHRKEKPLESPARVNSKSLPSTIQALTMKTLRTISFAQFIATPWIPEGQQAPGSCATSVGVRYLSRKENKDLTPYKNTTLITKLINVLFMYDRQFFYGMTAQVSLKPPHSQGFEIIFRNTTFRSTPLDE
jgi:hypothetical protein